MSCSSASSAAAVAVGSYSGHDDSAGQRLDQPVELVDRPQQPAADDARLGQRVGRNDPVVVGMDADHGDDAGHPSDRAVEAELADERQVADDVERDHVESDEQPDRDRQIEP